MCIIIGISWWRNQMETFSALVALCAGNSPVTGHKGQWMFSLICAWINGWVNDCEAGDLRRHRAHYGVTVMGCGVVVKVLVHCSDYLTAFINNSWHKTWDIFLEGNLRDINASICRLSYCELLKRVRVPTGSEKPGKIYFFKVMEGHGTLKNHQKSWKSHGT